jgi:hypothetical protein
MAELTEEQKAECQVLLDAAAEAQTAYWDALGALEQALGFDVEVGYELTGTTVDHLLEAENADDDEDDDGDEEGCDCADRGWHGTYHDTQCPLGEKPSDVKGKA